MNQEITFYRRLCETLKQSIPATAVVVGQQNRILAAPSSRARSDATAILNQHSSVSHTLYTHRENGVFICHILLIGENTAVFHSYLACLLHLFIRNSDGSPAPLRPLDQTILVNQLIVSGPPLSNAIFTLKQMGYSLYLPRQAVLITALPSVKVQGQTCSLQNILTEFFLSDPAFTAEDICGFPTEETCLIFKQVPSESDSRKTLHSFLLRLRETLFDTCCLQTVIAVGSPYVSPEDLHNSFAETDFLLSHASALYDNSGQTKAVLYIEDFLFEYLMSKLPPAYLTDAQKPLTEICDADPVLSQTIAALCRHNCSPTAAAKELGLHRNTLQQRLHKLKNKLEGNSLNDDRRRMLFHTFHLLQNQSRHLHAGIVIQPGSILHKGLWKLSEFLYNRSHGSIRLSDHNTAVSGDNQMLLDLLSNHDLDIAVLFTGSLNAFTGGRASVLELPFLFDSVYQAERALNTVAIQELSPSVENAGLRLSHIWTMGWRYLTSGNAPVAHPDDLKGKYVRTMHHTLSSAYFESIGAIPIFIGYQNLPEALKTDTVFCQENPAGNILETGLYRYQHFLTDIPFTLSSEALLVSSNVWESLSPEQQTIFTECVSDTTAWLYEEQSRLTEHSLSILTSQKGMRLVHPDADAQAAWKQYADTLHNTYKNTPLYKKIQTVKEEFHDV